MYAIETKKRKFDRILDSIKDHANATSSPPKPALPIGQASTTSVVIAQDQIASPKKPRLASHTVTVQNASTSSLPSMKTANYLPASREAFLDRLETFASVTKWRVPSTDAINAAAWAKRGWKCTATDMVACGYCKEQLLVNIENYYPAVVPANHSTQAYPETMGGGNSDFEDAISDVQERQESAEDKLDVESEFHASLVVKYADMVTTAHNEACPWRRRGCIDSIQRIDGLLSTQTVLSSLQERYSALVDHDDFINIPTVYLTGASSQPVIDLTQFNFDKRDARVDRNALLLSISGWQKACGRGRDVVECRNCFRHLGLWLYRGEEPTMEKLDGVESHLEYCPWRSAEAQTTSVEVEGKMKLISGWELVLRAVQPPSRPLAEQDDDLQIVGSTQPSEKRDEQKPELEGKVRERKMKDLLRRIRELKRPFNVKAFLREKTRDSDERLK